MKAYRFEGCYNILQPSEREAKWCIEFPDEANPPKKHLQVTMEIGCRYDAEGEDDPWEVANNIEAYMNDCLYHSEKKEVFGLIKWMRDNESTLRAIWLRWKIKAAEEQIEKMQKQLSFLKYDLADITKPAEVTP